MLAEASLTQQIKDLVLDDLRAGRWPYETKLPSEAELTTEYTRPGEQVSRVTIRRALMSLEDEGGFVVGRGGRGWFSIYRPDAVTRTERR